MNAAALPNLGAKDAACRLYGHRWTADGAYCRSCGLVTPADPPTPAAGTRTWWAGDEVTYTGDRVRVYGGWFDTAEKESGLLIYIAARHAPKADTLATGELQPRLPGDVGAVRDLEIATPPLADVPFSLTGDPSDDGAAQLSLLPAGVPPARRGGTRD